MPPPDPGPSTGLLLLGECPSYICLPHASARMPLWAGPRPVPAQGSTNGSAINLHTAHSSPAGPPTHLHRTVPLNVYYCSTPNAMVQQQWPWAGRQNIGAPGPPQPDTHLHHCGLKSHCPQGSIFPPPRQKAQTRCSFALLPVCAHLGSLPRSPCLVSLKPRIHFQLQ